MIGEFLLGYLLGSVPSAFLIGKMQGVDIRRQGSGNVGTMNAAKVLGKRAALAVLALDVGKGALAVILARWWGMSVGLVMLAAVFGHIFPLWLKGQGGKGLATALGSVLACGLYWPILFFALGWAVVYVPFRHSDAANLTGALTVAGASVFFANSRLIWWLIAVVLLVAVRHLLSIIRPRISSSR